MNHILVITNSDSDLLDILKGQAKVTVKTSEEAFSPEDYDAMCVLGGTEPSALAMSPRLHNLAERMHEAGKPIFFEFVSALFLTRTRGTENTVRRRMAYRASRLDCEGLMDGDLLDGQSNECIKYGRIFDTAVPILTYKEHVCAHKRIDMTAEEHKDGTFALWWYDVLKCLLHLKMLTSSPLLSSLSLGHHYAIADAKQ